MINKTMDNNTVAMVAKPYFARQKLWHERLSEGNQETICCGEVIGDDVQLWNRKQVT